MRILYRPLWEGVQNSLRDIFTEHYHADKVIQRQLKANRKWGSHDRRLFAETVYEMVRWWRKILFICDYQWPVTDEWTDCDPKVLQKLIESWCLLQGVELDKSIARLGLNRSELERRWNQTDFPPAVAESIPDWLEKWGSEQLGAQWPSMISKLNTPAPVYLRANLNRTTAVQLAEKLRQDKLEIDVINEECIKLTQRANVFLSKCFKDGLFEVQDFNSQMVGRTLAPEPGMRVIDACAGAGGKSLHLASIMRNRGKIIAMDVVEAKLGQLRERATRNGATSIESRWIENSKVIKRLAASADRLLLDVPCSGLGVIRRNPDSKWKLRPSEVEELIQTQRHILDSYSAMCKSGGIMVYATCSIMPNENREQVKAFLSRNETTWKLETEASLWPEIDGPDGFYIARLKRI